MTSNRWGFGTAALIAAFVVSACSESGLSSVECNSGGGPAATAVLDHEVDYNAFNSTFLRPEVAKLYGIDRDNKIGVVMVSVYQTDSPGVGVEACVSGEARNVMGQMKRLRFDEIREGAAIYHVGTFRISDEEQLTFELDVEIAATGKTHELKWQQQFWRG